MVLYFSLTKSCINFLVLKLSKFQLCTINSILITVVIPASSIYLVARTSQEYIHSLLQFHQCYCVCIINSHQYILNCSESFEYAKLYIKVKQKRLFINKGNIHFIDRLIRIVFGTLSICLISVVCSIVLCTMF